jgi:hypothetical protein
VHAVGRGLNHAVGSTSDDSQQSGFQGRESLEDVRWGVLKFQVSVSAGGQSALHEVASLCSGGLVGGGNNSMLS